LANYAAEMKFFASSNIEMADLGGLMSQIARLVSLPFLDLKQPQTVGLQVRTRV
jgi:hypothetical protein